jgi:peptide/nickel transport system substrate-binding protein
LVAAACGGGNDNEWAAARGQQAPQKGGVYRTRHHRLRLHHGFDPTGEYLGSAWTCTGRLTRTRWPPSTSPCRRATSLFPDLATETAGTSDDGLTYTFKLKSGSSSAPPAQPGDHRPRTSPTRSSASTPAPLVAQYGFYYFGVVKGMDGKAKSADQKISGIETPDDQTIIFHLSKATGDFLYRAAMPATGPIPEGGRQVLDQGRRLRALPDLLGPVHVQGSDHLDIVVVQGRRSRSPGSTRPRSST